MTLEIQSTMIETNAPCEWIESVREKLLEIWGQQACRCPEHWPDVCQSLLEKLGPLVDDAVANLTRLFGAGKPISDPAHAVWRLFPKLDHEHCTKLADFLIDGSARLPRQEAERTKDGGATGEPH